MKLYDYLDMNAPLLKTKTTIPPARGQQITRQRLLSRLDEGLRQGCKLTLVSAPAGYGKTTLVASWLRSGGHQAGWLSLEQGDNDPYRFFSYFITALQGLNPELGSSLLPALHSPQPPPIELLLVEIINQLVRQDSDGAELMELDDYHLIQNEAIHTALSYLLDHMPPNFHLVITTRQEPPLPLARLRARQELNELYQDDLRFDDSESRAFLVSTLPAALEPGEMAALQSRTEGWVAGLQLAAASLRRRENPSDFVLEFSGSSRYIFDYLVEEVLNQVQPELRLFLYRTAILERMTGALCDVVTGLHNSQSMLKILEDQNLFIVPLDDERQWYRYHPLFGELLLVHLGDLPDEDVQTLHGRASEWYRANGWFEESVHHALQAGDWKQAADLIGQRAMEMVGRGEIETLSAWLSKLPPEIMERSVGLCLARAIVHFLRGEIPAFWEWLEAANRALPAGKASRKAALLEIQALQSLAQIELGQGRPDLDAAQRLLELLPKDDLLLRGSLAFSLGVANRSEGDFEAAEKAFMAASESTSTEDNLLSAVIASYDLGELLADRGYLVRAERIHRKSVADLGARFGVEPESIPMAGAGIIGLARVYYEWGDLAAAQQHLEAGINLVERIGGLGISKDGYALLGLVKLLNEGHEQPELVEKAIFLANRVNRPEVAARLTPILVRYWLTGNDIAAAQDVIDRRRVDPTNALRYPYDWIKIEQLRIYIAHPDFEQNPKITTLARELLERLQAADQSIYLRRQLETWTLAAVYYSKMGEAEAALRALGEALQAAEQDRYVQIFLSLGETMQDLLHAYARQQKGPGYVRHVLSFYQEPRDGTSRQSVKDEITAQAAVPGYIEPLSERELEVLALVAAGLTNREIAQRLYITVGTTKRHLSNIYQKLGVSSRTQAAALSREYGLIE